MAKLPGAEAFGERPVVNLPRRTPMIATYRPTSGFEETASQELGQSASEFSQAANVALQAKEQQDNLRAEDAVTQLRQRQMELTLGPQGFANLKGGDAVNKPILKQYGGMFDQAAADLSGTLDNDYQKQLFSRRAAVAGMQLREDIGRHILQQGNVYADTVYKSKMDVEANVAASRWDKPDAAVVPMLNIENMINQRARYLGMTGPDGDAWVKDQRQQAESKVYSNMVKQALVSDPAKGPFVARELLQAHGDVINPDMRAVLTHEVNLAARPVEARADAQFATNAVLPKAGTSMELGGQSSLDRIASAEAKPTDYSFTTKAGTYVTGTAPSEQEALRRVALGSGQANALAQMRTGQTKVDTMALLGDAIAAGEQRAEQTHPGDIVYHDMVVNQIRAQFGTIAAVQQGIQKQNYETLIKALMPQEGGGAVPTTQEELFANSSNRAAFYALDPLQQSGVLAHLQHNLQASLGHPMKENSEVISDAANRIFLPAGDPNKIANVGQLIPLLNHGVGTGGFGFLSGLIDKSQSINGQKFSVAANRAYASAKSTLSSSWVGQANREAANDAAIQWYTELTNKIDQYQADNKDPRTLLQHGTPDSMVDRDKIMSYMQTTPQQAVAGQAAKVPTQRGTKTVATPVGSTGNPAKFEDYDSLSHGTYYKDRDGNLRQKQ